MTTIYVSSPRKRPAAGLAESKRNSQLCCRVWHGPEHQALALHERREVQRLVTRRTHRAGGRLVYHQNYSNASSATDTSGTLPIVNTLCIGDTYMGTASPGQPLYGHIKHIMYFPRRLSNIELQLLTK